MTFTCSESAPYDQDPSPVGMNRERAEKYVAFIADDAGSFRDPAGLWCDRPTDYDWLIGWQCGFESLFVRVRSYLPEIHLDETAAIDLAIDGLQERKWFAMGMIICPDYIIEPKVRG